MKNLANKSLYKRVALALSLCALILWSILGTGTSLAWFSDVSNEITNIFHIAEFDLIVSHRLTDGSWEEVDSQTEIFDDEALYEPGYVYVAYLKAENNGTIPFDLSVAVNVNGCIIATNVFGQEFMLQDYLKFGITISDSEEAMKNSVADRNMAVEIADMPLHNYDSEKVELAPQATKYIALVVRMPEQIDNIANYRGDNIPKVELGVTIKADQIVD